LNRVEAGANLGWVQIMGPLARLSQFRATETDPTAPQPFAPNGYFGLQQVRWSPENIATSPAEALDRLFTVYQGGRRFAAELDGDHEVPRVVTAASGEAEFRVQSDGSVRYRLRLANIEGVTQAHIHISGPGTNGPVVAFLIPFDPAGFDVGEERVVAEGVITADEVIARPGFDGTLAELVRRMRQGRTYVNVHTLAHPPGEVRGQIELTDGRAVSHYSDPEFSWKFEVAPGAVGFLDSRALGREYRDDLFTGAASPVLEGGQLFRFDLTRNRRNVAPDDPRLADRVADNLNKFDLTESESLLFGRDVGVATDIQTGPNGNLFVVSLTQGTVFEIFRREEGGRGRREEFLVAPLIAAPPAPAITVRSHAVATATALDAPEPAGAEAPRAEERFVFAERAEAPRRQDVLDRLFGDDEFVI
jgi:hypothetical protein